MTLQSQLITIENQSKVLSPRALFQIAWGVNYQVLYHYNRSSWVKDGFARPGHVQLLPAGVKPPAGAWNLILMDHSDQQGALGYHDDEQGTNIPYAEVFVVDSEKDGATVSSVASHEALEMLVDPFVDPTQPRSAWRKATNEFYIVEVCDAVQGNDYDVGILEDHETGVLVSDFCLPAWWGIGGFVGPYSFRRSVHHPFVIAPQGYMSIAPASDPSNWMQIFGERQDRRPAWSSRLPRIHG